MNKAGFFIFRCEQCGQQWLTQRFCCHRECAPAPQRLGSLADSMNVAELINFSIVLPLNGSTSSIRKAVGLWLKRLAGESFEFIFVAHSSPVGLFNYITEIAHTCTLRLLRLNARTSLGRSYNLGAQAARGRFLVLTESGIPHLPYSFPEAFEVALADARVGLVGFGNERQQLSEPAPPSHDRRYRFSSTSIRSSVVGLKSEVFWELGGIDERFSTYTMAMKDLQYRLIRSNYRLAQARLPRRSARRVSSLARMPQTEVRADRKRFALKYFRNGVVRFSEQIMTDACDREWFRRRASCLKTIHTPRGLVRRQNHATTRQAR